MNFAACQGLPRYPINGTWFRTIDPDHLPTALQSSHTAGVRTRFNAGPLLKQSDQFESLYFAEDPVVAQFEAGKLLGKDWIRGYRVAHPRRGTYATIAVDVILHEVFDLTEVDKAQVPLETNAQELTGDWECYEVRDPSTSVKEPRGISPTQRLGRELFLTRVEGFLALSAKVPYERTLVVFPQNLQRGRSRIVFRNPKDPAGLPLHQIS